MNKILKEKLNGIVVKKYVPNVYENGQYIDEEKIDIIELEIKCADKIIKLVKPRESDYSRLFVNDSVVLDKYLISGNYEEYIEILRQYIYNYNSANPDKENIFNRYNIAKEEFNKKPLGIIDYEINFSNL